MVKIEMKEGQSLVHCSGTLDEILTDLSEAICGMHAQIKKANPIMATMFKQVFIEAVTEADSPIWNPENSHGVGISFCVPKR